MKVLLIDQIAQINYKYSFSLANALKRQGNTVELVVDDKQDNDYCSCPVNNVFITSRKDVSKIGKLVNYTAAYSYIIRKTSKECFDIVHVQWFQFSPIDYLFLKKLKKKGIWIVVTVHDILPFNKKIYDKLFHGKIYDLCDRLIVQSKPNINRIRRLFSKQVRNKVVFIPHGNFLDFAEIHNKADSRKRLGISKNKKVFLFFGQIKKVKGVGVLLEAFGKIVKERSDIFLVIAGRVWKDSFEKYQSIIDKNGLSEEQLMMNIGFIPDDEVGYYYSAADIAVLPYLDVYQSGVVHLAYSYHLPVIATDIPGLNDVVKDGETGYLCEAGDVDGLARTMERAADDSDNWCAMGDAGAENDRIQYSWDKIAKGIDTLYRSL